MGHPRVIGGSRVGHPATQSFVEGQIWATHPAYRHFVLFLCLLGTNETQGLRSPTLRLTLRVSELPKPIIARITIELFPTVLRSCDVLQFRFDERTYPMARFVLGHSSIDNDPRSYDFDFI